jgi:hypothetical protein
MIGDGRPSATEGAKTRRRSTVQASAAAWLPKVPKNEKQASGLPCKPLREIRLLGRGVR